MSKKKKLPPFFRPLLWSYDFTAMNPVKDKQTIVVNTINYGDLPHWSWLKHFYGPAAIRKVLKKTPATALRPRAARLAAIVFNLGKKPYASRRPN